MMKFRTEIEIGTAQMPIGHRDAILTMGSCFADNIAGLLKERYFSVLQNPFGTLYNPLSLAEAMTMIIEQRKFTANDLFYYRDEWHSFWHHSTFSGENQNDVLRRINRQIRTAHQFLSKAKWLFLTFGTAFVYFHLPEKRLVANCHKLPENEFLREPADPKTIVQNLSRVFADLKEINPNVNILLTVSPIRHLRDGLVQNQRSKAILLLAVHELIEQNKHVFYFPAYEIMMDDLRDYRFYEANLTHPNDQAVQYIWEKFSDLFFTEATRQVAAKFFALTTALRHRVRNAQSPMHRRFLRTTLQRIESLALEYPYVNLEEARQQISAQLKAEDRSE